MHKAIPHFQALKAILLIPSLLAATEAITWASKGAFSFGEGDTLEVQWRGLPLIQGDYISSISPEPLRTTSDFREEMVGEWKVRNLWKTAEAPDKVSYRREIATNGHEIELTTEFQVPSYYVFPYNKLNRYSFTIPVKALEGATFQANGIRNKNSKGLTGRISAQMPDGPILGSSISYIAFEGKERPGLIVDFKPTGATSFNGYGPSVLQGIWKVEKEGELLRFSFTGRAAAQNGVFAGKVKILEGTAEDYYRLHPFDTYHYYSKIPSVRNISFGAGVPASKWSAADTQRHTPERGFGWLDMQGITLEGDAAKGVLRARARGEGKHRFRLDVPQPGIYIVTARIAAEETPLGPFGMDSNGTRVAEGIQLSPQEIKTVTFSTYTDDKSIELALSGSWSISSLAAQALIYQTEDVSFKRGVWLAKGVPTPTNLHQFTPAMPPPHAFIESTTRREHPGDAAVLNASLPEPENLEGSDTAGMDWRWKGNIGSLGPGNYGSFHEFQTDEKIEKRLDELKASGYQVLILNGLHFRTAWAEQLPRVQQTVARIVELAHRRDMKIIEHHSSTVIPHQATAFNGMLERLDQTLREVENGQVTRGYCLNNPTFRESLLSDVTTWVLNTKSDGLMLDELSFHTGDFCGCTHCREKFHADTGIWMPTDETAPSLFDKRSRLWVLWLKWRNQTLGNWSLELNRRIRKNNPDFVLMKYSTHYGAASDFITLGQGGGLHEDARSSNFLGTEIMSRNVYATYRANLAYRSIFNSFRTRFNIPIFALVYPNDQPLFAYAGWAMNNMRGQSTWSIISIDKVAEEASYLTWKDNMDIRAARPVSDVAVVFSSNSRDFARLFSHSSDLVGTCEQLDDMHIPYDVLLNESLNAETLSRYRTLILPSVSAMSDGELKTIRDYLEKGGSVMAMGNTATLDESGNERLAWPIGEWLGIRWKGDTVKGPIALSGKGIDGLELSLPDSVIKVEADQSGAAAEILAETHSGSARYIAIAERKIGNGTLLFSAPRLGAANYEPEVATGKKLNYQYNPLLAKLFTQMVKRLQPEKPRFEAILIPREVRTSLYEVKEGNQTVRLLHLYNASGAAVAKGASIPRTPPTDPFPKLAADLLFDITLEGSGDVSVDVVSPDFPESRPVKLKDLGNRRYRVTVSKDDLKVYSMVRLRSEER